MTRIAPGISLPHRSPIEETACQHAPNPEVSAATVAEGTRAPDVLAGASRDQPMPQTSASPRATTIDVHALATDLLKWEGEVKFMYLDTRGFVTTGIGNKLVSGEEAMALPWRHKDSGLAATSAEIRAAFMRVDAMRSEYVGKRPDGENPYKATHYESKTDLVLAEGAAMPLAIKRLNEDFLPALRGLFRGFDGYPAPAQRALVDMIYTLGADGLRKKFPNFVAACKRRDFATAAAESHRRSRANEHRQGDARNAATRDLLLEAARLSEAVQMRAGEVRL